MNNSKIKSEGPDLRPFRPYGIPILKFLSMIAITASVVTIAYHFVT